ncbi:hypothetical protein M501DRAFT_279866 [Patellaria atrata CBS 101060]|uniref:Uncharacterized protein n=1 Tax=Patellaria atrata CBS 101060 TaxID=1346257 RepID=A0A9P4S6C9_9PEZI|nr:hypothetical protein M501DRAFT_279866 [Patellaria atrata CBS 101060]
MTWRPRIAGCEIYPTASSRTEYHPHALGQKRAALVLKCDTSHPVHSRRPQLGNASKNHRWESCFLERRLSHPIRVCSIRRWKAAQALGISWNCWTTGIAGITQVSLARGPLLPYSMCSYHHNNGVENHHKCGALHPLLKGNVAYMLFIAALSKTIRALQNHTLYI